jgi:PAS domain S-box-containing protein
LTARTFALEDTAFAVGMGLDMTERRDALRQVEFQASLLAQVETAVIASEQDGRVIYWNEHAERMYGHTKAEALGRDITELTVPPHAMATATAILTEVLEAGSWTG